MTLKFVIHNFFAYLATFESGFTTYLGTTIHTLKRSLFT